MSGRTLILVDPRYFRRTEVDVLRGDYGKAKARLGWSPRVTFAQLVDMMADADLAAVQRGLPFVLDPSLATMREAMAELGV